jgi:hypothetical protein
MNELFLNSEMIHAVAPFGVNGVSIRLSGDNSIDLMLESLRNLKLTTGVERKAPLGIVLPEEAIEFANTVAKTDAAFGVRWWTYNRQGFLPSCRVDFDARLALYELYFGGVRVIRLEPRTSGTGVGNLKLADGSHRALATYSGARLTMGKRLQEAGALPAYSERTLGIARRALETSESFRAFWEKHSKYLGNPFKEKLSREDISAALEAHFRDMTIAHPKYIGFVIFNSDGAVLSSASGISKEKLLKNGLESMYRRLKGLDAQFERVEFVGGNLVLIAEALAVQFFING